MTLKLIGSDGSGYDMNEVVEFFKAFKKAEVQAAEGEKLAAFIKSQGQPDTKPEPAPIPSPEQQFERVLAVQRERVLRGLDGATMATDGGITYEARLKFKLHASLVDELAAAGYGVSQGDGNNSVVSWTFKPRATASSVYLGEGDPVAVLVGTLSGFGGLSAGDMVVNSAPAHADWTPTGKPFLPSAAQSRLNRDADDGSTGGQRDGYLRLIRTLIREAKPNTNGGCLAHYRYEFELPVLPHDQRTQVLKLLADQGYRTASRYRNNPEQKYIAVLF